MESLTIEEAARQLRELDRLMHQRRITGIAYRNRKEKLLARIKQPVQPITGVQLQQQQHRYMTRRQLATLNPPLVAKTSYSVNNGTQPYIKTSLHHTDPLTDKATRAEPAQRQYQPTQLMRQELDDFIVVDGEGESDEWEPSSLDNESAASGEKIEAVREAPTLAENERRELEEHFRSVTVRFNPAHRPMFPPKTPRTVQIDFGDSLSDDIVNK